MTEKELIYLNSKKISQTAAAAALAIVLGYVESLVPLPFPVPGIKLGLSNICLVFVLYRINTKTAWIIMLIKIILSSAFFNGFQTFWFSLCGGVLSMAVMSILKTLRIFSISGISILGGVMHNIGQLLSAAYILNSLAVFVYLPPLLISGALSGLLIGILCELLLKYIPN